MSLPHQRAGTDNLDGDVFPGCWVGEPDARRELILIIGVAAFFSVVGLMRLSVVGLEITGS